MSHFKSQEIGFIVLVLNGIMFVLAHPAFRTVVARISEPHLLYLPWLASLQPLSAEKALADFAAAARSETDLGSLTGQLVGLTEKTLMPEQVSIWLKKEESKE